MLKKSGKIVASRDFERATGRKMQSFWSQGLRLIGWEKALNRVFGRSQLRRFRMSSSAKSNSTTLAVTLTTVFGAGACTSPGHGRETELPEANPLPGDVELQKLRRENAELRQDLGHTRERLRRFETSTNQTDGDDLSVSALGQGPEPVSAEPSDGSTIRSPSSNLEESADANLGGSSEGQEDKNYPAISLGSADGEKVAVSEIPVVPEGEWVLDESGEHPVYSLIGSELKTKPARSAQKPAASKAKLESDRTPERTYHDAMKAYRRGELEIAARHFKQVSDFHPSHAFADNALYWQGEIQYDQRRYEEALQSFFAVVEKYSGGNKVPDAMLKVGLCYKQLGDLPRAREVLLRIIDAFPRSEVAKVAQQRLAGMQSNGPIDKGS